MKRQDAGWAVAGLLFQVVVALVVVLVARERSFRQGDTRRPIPAVGLDDGAVRADPLGRLPADGPLPGVATDDAAGFVRAAEARLAVLARRIDRARGAPRPVPGAESSGVATGTFVHIYYYYGRACDGLWRLRLEPDPARGDTTRQQVLDDLLAAERMLRSVESGVPAQPAGGDGPGVSGSGPALPSGPGG